MSAHSNSGAGREWRDHWPIVLAGMAGMASSTIHSYSLGLFIEPLQQDYGWSRTAITAGAALSAPVVVLLAPFLGAAIDRLGSRRIAIIGVLGQILTTIALAFAGPDLWSWWSVWGVIALVNVVIQPAVWTSAVSGYFTAGRGLALAVTLCGSGIASMITPFLTYQLIAHFGWRGGYIGLGLFWAVLVLPPILFLFNSVRDEERTGARAIPVIAQGQGGAAWPLLLNPRFIRLALAGGLIAAVVMSLVPNLVPVLSWGGMSRGDAAAIVALLGIASITGRLAIGFLLDRLPGQVLAAIAVCLPLGTSILLLGFPGSSIAAAAAVLCLGFTLGAELDVVAYLTTRYFGLRNFGLLFASIGGVITLVSALGPLALNIIYDATSSYATPLWAYVPMCLTSALLFLSLGRYPDRMPDSLSPEEDMAGPAGGELAST